MGRRGGAARRALGALLAALGAAAAAGRAAPARGGGAGGRGGEVCTPLVGVVSQPGAPAPGAATYVAASYVKFLEAAGARPVPIVAGAPEAELRALFPLLSGVVFPGGSAPLQGGSYMDSVGIVFQLAEEANASGRHFPLWGVCLGFEAMAVVSSGRGDVISDCSAEDAAAPLQFVGQAAARGSGVGRLFSDFRPSTLKAMAERPVVMENHKHCVSPGSFEALLSNDWTLLATSEDREGTAYVAAMEHRSRPYYGVQYHPEKDSFEWSPNLHIPHDADAVAMNLQHALFFGEELRRQRTCQPSEAAVDELLIYNYPAHFTGKVESRDFESDFEQAYFFGATEQGRPASE